MPKSKLTKEIKNIDNELKNVVKTSKIKKPITSKTTVSKSEVKEKITSEKNTAKVATRNSAKNTIKKSTSKNSSKKSTSKTIKNSTSKTLAKATKKTASKNLTKSTTIKSRKKSVKSKSPLSEISNKGLTNIVEYYDLPYTYDKTIVKLLYQNPNTLFVYWDIASKDTNNFKKLYGENFLNITHPVLIVHNKTNNYTFEIDINDFANNWYIHVNDPKCKYEVKLGRRPTISSEIKNEVTGKYSNFVDVSNSNTIEMPNDHVLFYKNNQVLKFKNIKTNSIKERIYNFGSTFSKKIKSIYNGYNLDEVNNGFDFQNPSSNNPSSNVM